MVKKYSDLYLDARKALLPKEGLQQAAFLARQLLCSVSGKTQTELVAARDLFASEEIGNRLTDAVQRLLADEPLAYVLGQWEFYGMTLEVNRDVLIPRDDTMAVAELAVKKTMYLQQDPRVLDLCTGSGCIGLAVAHRVKDARVTLADCSREALAVAKRNITGQHLSARVSAVQADALKPAPAFLGQFDLIVSNPPYVTDREMEQLEPSVKNYEPHLALCGGQDGLDFYRAIVKNYTSALRPGGYLCFEFGMGQGSRVCEILAAGGYEILEIKQDYSKIDRAVLARKERKEEDQHGNEENSL